MLQDSSGLYPWKDVAGDSIDRSAFSYNAAVASRMQAKTVFTTISSYKLAKYGRYYIVCLIMLTFTAYQLTASGTFLKLLHNHRMYAKYGKRIILTGRGWLSYSTIDHEVFRGFDYYMSENTVPIPKLKYLKEPTCKKIFTDWLRFQNRSTLFGPVADLPRDEDTRFGMYYTARKYQKFRNNPLPDNSQNWTELDYWTQLPSDEIFHIGNGEHLSVAIYNAVKYHNISGQVGMVFGSRNPWLEAFALNLGASEVLSVGRGGVRIMSSATKVKYINIKKMADTFEKYIGTYDFAASYSAIEHVGLGRFGEAIDPIGDLRVVQQMNCLLKPGGLLFLGIPRGQDIIVYNRRRIYGRMRLAMVMTGFDWIATFRGTEDQPVSLELDDLDGYDDRSGVVHDIFVLRKI